MYNVLGTVKTCEYTAIISIIIWLELSLGINQNYIPYLQRYSHIIYTQKEFNRQYIMYICGNHLTLLHNTIDK